MINNNILASVFMQQENRKRIKCENELTHGKSSVSLFLLEQRKRPDQDPIVPEHHQIFSTTTESLKLRF